MSRDSIIDYLSYILFRAWGFLIRGLPPEFSLFLGRRLGDLLYYFDLKHKAIAYANLKIALGNKLSPYQISNLTHKFYQGFGQSFIEIFLIPLVNKEYLNKYISIDGLHNLASGFKQGKGVILLGVHAGNWELFNVISAQLGFPFSLLVRQQKRYKRLGRLLDFYRSQKGCRIIQRKNQTRQLIEALKKNEAIGMSVDQGGKTGIRVKFFAKEASMATGALRLALRYGATIIPGLYTRVNGPYIKIIIEPPFEIKKTAEPKKDIYDNLQRLVLVFEKYISMYPQEYLWSYKIWKYGNDKNILILNDGKTGHLRQAQAVANIISGYLQEKGISPQVENIEVKFKGKISRYALTLSSCLSGRYNCQGCLWCLRRFLRRDVYDSLISLKPDIIISCGSQVAPVNFVLARENLAKSVVIMRPSFLSTGRFDLVILPKHDSPYRRKNIIVTEGALNLIDEKYLEKQSQTLIQASSFKLQASSSYIGFLIGGDTKNFRLKPEMISEVINQIKSVSESLNVDILVTTSRRTSREIENLIKEEFKDYSRCKLLVIANEKNLPEAVGGILGLSQIIITSPESISMISEAVNSKNYVLVFKSPGLSPKHKRFLDYFAKNKYIYLTESFDLGKRIEDIWQNRPAINTLSDNLLVREAIKKIL